MRVKLIAGYSDTSCFLNAGQPDISSAHVTFGCKLSIPNYLVHTNAYVFKFQTILHRTVLQFNSMVSDNRFNVFVSMELLFSHFTV